VRRIRQLATAAGVLLALAAGACAGTAEVAGDRIFEAAPWTGEERFVYRLFDRGLDGEPACELLTIPGEAETRLEEHCANGPFRDDSVVVVGSADLAPVRSERVISDLAEEKRVAHIIEYGDTSASFSTDDGEKSRETTRALPTPTSEHPDPAWYDDKSLFWLARGLPLAPGYRATYVHVINVGAPRVLAVEVRVEGRETIETPVGTFETWKLRFERDNTVYFLWVATEPPRPVVRARIESVTYELVTMETGERK
jgi:hypothetical protein